MVSVLLISLLLAAIAGAVLLYWFMRPMGGG
jgi:integral membrane sensor domain MASE1